jgi:hypothetical protein
MVDITMIKLLLWRIVWLLIPLWLGTLIYQKTGYILAMKNKDGKPVQFYFQREQPLEFKVWGKW